MPNDTPIYPEFASLGESLGAPAELEALTPDESIQISIRLEELDTPMQRYLEDVSKVPPLEAGELEDLTARICGGEEPAAHRLIEARLKLVMSIAQQYRGRGMAYIDLVQAGNLGLICAMDKIRATGDPRLSRYTGWWIRQAIVRELAELPVDHRIPVKKIEQIQRCVSAFRAFREGYGRDPSEEELAEELGMSVQQLRAELPPISDLIPAEELEAKPLSLVPADPEERAEMVRTLMEPRERLDVLPRRERRLIEGVFGLDGTPVRSIGELAEELRISSARVRQLLNKAVRRLQRGSRPHLEEPSRLR